MTDIINNATQHSHSRTVAVGENSCLQRAFNIKEKRG